MSGERFLLDTNAVVSLLAGNAALSLRLSDADWVGISVVTVLEFLCFSGLTQQDIDTFNMFRGKVDVIGIHDKSTRLIAESCGIRNKIRLKLPDAIIAATALECGATLVTNDLEFSREPRLGTIRIPIV